MPKDTATTTTKKDSVTQPAPVQVPVTPDADVKDGVRLKVNPALYPVGAAEIQNADGELVRFDADGTVVAAGEVEHFTSVKDNGKQLVVHA